ncbi:hypothetical protein QE152_g37677 [Popillia japonica]|uniref:Uncharacterized protein n=1 Tax=Popillia japonica TaxID=7064 RepID=A0AAW1I994_POPJA
MQIATALFKRDQCEEALEAPPVETDSIEIKNKFQRADAKAQAIIVQGITDKHLDIIKDSKSAREQLKALKDVFVRTSSFTKLSLWRKLKDSKSAREQLKALKDVFVRTSSFTKLSLWRKLINLKLGVNEKLEDHFFKFDTIIRELKESGSNIDESDKVCHLFTIIRELKESGSNIDESDKVCHLLLSLPSKFDTVVTALETIPAVKIDFVKSRLLDEEIKAKSKQEGKNSRLLDEEIKAKSKQEAPATTRRDAIYAEVRITFKKIMRSVSMSAPATTRRDAIYAEVRITFKLDARKHKKKEIEVRLGQITEVEEEAKVIEQEAEEKVQRKQQTRQKNR